MYKNIYSSFKHWYTDNGTIYLYSDPHFSDLDAYKFRFPEEFNFECCENRPSDEWIVEELDKKQIKSINKVCGKNDTLIILGDVGNIECVKKLKAKYKVLILGNHDSGASNYISEKSKSSLYTDAFEYKTIDNGSRYVKSLDEAKSKFLHQNLGYKIIETKVEKPYGMCITDYVIIGKESLFDEVYEGKLQIAPKVVLSHMPVTDEYSLNIHGHVHDKQKAEVKYYEVNDKIIRASFNCCAESINYTPINLTKLLTSGCLKLVPSQYRETIDRATAEKLKKE